MLLSVPAALPADAAWRDWWPFGRKQAEEPIPDPFPYRATLDVVGGERRIEKALSRASTLVQREDLPPSGLMGLLAGADPDTQLRILAAADGLLDALAVDPTGTEHPLLDGDGWD